MPSLDDLDLVQENFPDPVDLDEIPEQVVFEAVQPGTYTFTLPQDFDWKTVDSQFGQRLKLELRLNKDTKVDYRLSYKVKGVDKKLSVGLSNIPIGKMASKLDYLLAALKHMGVLRNNTDYTHAFMNQGGAQFKADAILTAGNKNTGERYSTRPYTNKTTGKEVKPIPRDADGKYPSEFVDQHGETLRCFVDLENFRSAD